MIGRNGTGATNAFAKLVCQQTVQMGMTFIHHQLGLWCNGRPKGKSCLIYCYSLWTLHSFHTLLFQKKYWKAAVQMFHFPILVLSLPVVDCSVIIRYWWRYFLKGIWGFCFSGIKGRNNLNFCKWIHDNIDVISSVNCRVNMLHLFQRLF